MVSGRGAIRPTSASCATIARWGQARHSTGLTRIGGIFGTVTSIPSTEGEHSVSDASATIQLASYPCTARSRPNDKHLLPVAR